MDVTGWAARRTTLVRMEVVADSKMSRKRSLVGFDRDPKVVAVPSVPSLEACAWFFLFFLFCLVALRAANSSLVSCL